MQHITTLFANKTTHKFRDSTNSYLDTYYSQYSPIFCVDARIKDDRTPFQINIASTQNTFLLLTHVECYSSKVESTYVYIKF